MPEINYLAVLVAGISNMVVGSIWYGPLFGKMWMEELYRNDPTARDRMKTSGMSSLYIKQFILALLMAYILSHVVWGMNRAFDRPADFMSAISTAVWMWLGFVVPILYGASLWTGKKFKYVAIDLGYWVIVLGVMSLIISLWQ